MPDFKTPDEDVLLILDALGIAREGWAVQLQNEDTIVLLHFETHLELIIYKGVKRTWL